MKMYIPSTFTLGYVRAKMIVNAFMIQLDQLDYWYPKKLKTCGIQRIACSLVISQILSEFRLEGATYKTLHNNLKRIMQIC